MFAIISNKSNLEKHQKSSKQVNLVASWHDLHQTFSWGRISTAEGQGGALLGI